MKKGAKPSTRVVERGLAEGDLPQYELRLYVAGMSPRSTRAIANIQSICEEFLTGRYDLKVFDLHQQPAMAAGEQIVAVPTLLKLSPLPLRRIIGDLSDRQKVLAGLDLKAGP